MAEMNDAILDGSTTPNPSEIRHLSHFTGDSPHVSTRRCERIAPHRLHSHRSHFSHVNVHPDHIALSNENILIKLGEMYALDAIFTLADVASGSGNLTRFHTLRQTIGAMLKQSLAGEFDHGGVFP